MLPRWLIWSTWQHPESSSRQGSGHIYEGVSKLAGLTEVGSPTYMGVSPPHRLRYWAEGKWESWEAHSTLPTSCPEMRCDQLHPAVVATITWWWEAEPLSCEWEKPRSSELLVSGIFVPTGKAVNTALHLESVERLLYYFNQPVSGLR